MFRTIAIVQARMGSTRLPGKSLMPLCGRPLLGLLLERLKRCRELGGIIVATTTNVIDDAIEQLVQQMSLECVRGSETDVLGRFMQALEQFPSQAVVRVCADNPLTDPEQVDALVKFFWDKGCDYAYNNRPECGLPDGVGAEVVLADALRRVDQEATLAKYREHVTLYIIDHPDLFRIAQLKAPKHLWFPDIRLDVDYQEDLNFLQRLCELLPADLAPFWTVADIIKVVKGMPDILKLRHERD